MLDPESYVGEKHRQSHARRSATAELLGLTVPLALLGRSDEVIE
jgi:hypothetical protein